MTGFGRIVQTPLLYVYLAAGVMLAVPAGLALPGKAALPLLQVAVAYPVMYSLLARGQRKRAVISMLFWALLLGIVMVVTVVHAPEASARSILHGPEYVDEMFRWIHTGIGAESTPSQFIPQHLLHLAIFVILSLVTGSVLSLLMGAALMNYMSFYVGNVILASRDFWMAVFMGWHPWSIVRVASFVVLGVILGEPLICRVSGRAYEPSGARRYLWFALAGIVADMVIKALLAPWWQSTLHGIIN